MAIQYAQGDMEKGVGSVSNYTESFTELKNSLQKLTEDLETHSWNSDGGRRMGENIKNFINREMRAHVEFLEGKIKDLNAARSTTDEMHRA